MLKIIADKFSCYFGIHNDVTVPTLLTLFVFLVGLLINMVYSYTMRRTHRKLAELNLSRLIKEVRKQAGFYNSYVDLFDINKNGNVVLTYQNIPSLEVFKEIGYERLYKAYFSGFENIFASKLKIDSFSKLTECLEFIKETFHTSIHKIEEQSKELRDLNNVRNVAVGRCMKNIEEFQLYFRRELDPWHVLGQYYSKQAKLVNEWEISSDSTSPIKVETLFQEIKKLNNEDLDLMRKYNNDTNMLELNFLINEASVTYQNSERYVSSVRDSFSYLGKKYYENATNLFASYRRLRGGLCKFKK